ncbi:hypothetical protein ACC754_44495, partial [Rhizobium johnstonii]
KEASIGALISFRCAYFFIPLALGTTLLVISEVFFRNDGRGLMLDQMKASAEVFEFFSQFLQTAFQDMTFVDRERLLD